MDNLSLEENGITFKSIEEEIYRSACDAACSTMKKVLEDLDRRLMNTRNSKKFRNKGFKHTCIKTIMGNIEYDKRIYEYKTPEGKKDYKFLLDEYLQMNTIGHYSSSVVEKVIDNVVDLSYRKTAENIERLTNQSMSHMAVWNMVQRIGDSIEDKHSYEVDLYNKGALKGTRQSSAVFQEMDGLWINMQGKDRPKSGKSRKKEIKLGIVYDGWKLRKGSTKEYELANKISYSVFGSAEKFKTLGEAVITSRYDEGFTTLRVINGDGAPWIKAIAAERGDTYYQLDPFHRSQAIIRHIKDKKECNKVLKLFKQAKVSEGLEYISQLLIKYNNDEEQFDKLTKLYNYFSLNQSGLTPYKSIKGINVPEPPEGIEYRNMGTMEPNICATLAKRLKHMRASWSKAGASSLANILTEKQNGTIGNTINRIYNDIVTDESCNELGKIIVISANEVDKDLTKKESTQIKKCSMPYDGISVTAGRNVIRSILRNKTLTELHY